MSVNHGANLYDLSKKYGFSKDEFLDLFFLNNWMYVNLAY